MSQTKRGLYSSERSGGCIAVIARITRDKLTLLRAREHCAGNVRFGLRMVWIHGVLWRQGIQRRINTNSRFRMATASRSTITRLKSLSIPPPTECLIANLLLCCFFMRRWPSSFCSIYPYFAFNSNTTIQLPFRSQFLSTYRSNQDDIYVGHLRGAISKQAYIELNRHYDSIFCPYFQCDAVFIAFILQCNRFAKKRTKPPLDLIGATDCYP
jgi:hypothetical protein